MSTNISGISADIDLTIEWPELGEFLGWNASPEQAEFLIAFASQKAPHTQAAYIADDIVDQTRSAGQMPGTEYDEAERVAQFYGAIAGHIREKVGERIREDKAAA